MKNYPKHSNSLVFIAALLIFSSCAPEGPSVKEYGFFYGIWHGFIFFPALFGKLFNLDIGIHALNNSGFWYWLGYIIGIGGVGGGGVFGGRRSRRSKY